MAMQSTAMYDGSQQQGTMGAYHNPVYNQAAGYPMNAGTMYVAPRPVAQNGMAANYAGYNSTSAAMNRAAGLSSNMMMMNNNQSALYNANMVRQNLAATGMYPHQQSRLPTAAAMPNAYQTNPAVASVVTNTQTQGTPAYQQANPLINPSTTFRPHPSSVQPSQSHLNMGRVDQQQLPAQSTAVPPVQQQGAPAGNQTGPMGVTNDATVPNRVAPMVNGDLVQKGASHSRPPRNPPDLTPIEYTPKLAHLAAEQQSPAPAQTSESHATSASALSPPAPVTTANPSQAYQSNLSRPMQHPSSTVAHTGAHAMSPPAPAASVSPAIPNRNQTFQSPATRPIQPLAPNAANLGPYAALSGLNGTTQMTGSTYVTTAAETPVTHAAVSGVGRNIYGGAVPPQRVQGNGVFVNEANQQHGTKRSAEEGFGQLPPAKAARNDVSHAMTHPQSVQGLNVTSPAVQPSNAASPTVQPSDFASPAVPAVNVPPPSNQPSNVASPSVQPSHALSTQHSNVTPTSMHRPHTTVTQPAQSITTPPSTYPMPVSTPQSHQNFTPTNNVVQSTAIQPQPTPAYVTPMTTAQAQQSSASATSLNLTTAASQAQKPAFSPFLPPTAVGQSQTFVHPQMGAAFSSGATLTGSGQMQQTFPTGFGTSQAVAGLNGQGVGGGGALGGVQGLQTQAGTGSGGQQVQALPASSGQQVQAVPAISQPVQAMAAASTQPMQAMPVISTELTQPTPAIAAQPMPSIPVNSSPHTQPVAAIPPYQPVGSGLAGVAASLESKTISAGIGTVAARHADAGFQQGVANGQGFMDSGVVDGEAAAVSDLNLAAGVGAGMRAEAPVIVSPEVAVDAASGVPVVSPVGTAPGVGSVVASTLPIVSPVIGAAEPVNVSPVPSVSPIVAIPEVAVDVASTAPKMSPFGAFPEVGSVVASTGRAISPIGAVPEVAADVPSTAPTVSPIMASPAVATVVEVTSAPSQAASPVPSSISSSSVPPALPSPSLVPSGVTETATPNANEGNLEGQGLPDVVGDESSVGGGNEAGVSLPGMEQGITELPVTAAEQGEVGSAVDVVADGEGGAVDEVPVLNSVPDNAGNDSLADVDGAAGVDGVEGGQS
ncbi:hypothetical protein HDV00_006901 [Rhizophlyctis rosea]|nr:hypothetical protein HDV00_006901 [Rhizophlyctis rosea]